MYFNLGSILDKKKYSTIHFQILKHCIYFTKKGWWPLELTAVASLLGDTTDAIASPKFQPKNSPVEPPKKHRQSFSQVSPKIRNIRVAIIPAVYLKHQKYLQIYRRPSPK